VDPSRPKLSAALLEFADPLLSILPPGAGAQPMKSMLALAVLVWNAVALERLGRPSPYMQEARRLLQANAAGPAAARIRRALDELEFQKRHETPPDLRIISTFELRGDGRKGLTLHVSEGALRADVGGTLGGQISSDPSPAAIHADSAPDAASPAGRKSSASRSRPRAEHKPLPLDALAPARGGRRAPRKAVNHAQATPSLGSEDGTWFELYRLAKQFRILEPWRWMGDAERFGVSDPNTGRIDWCVVMGGGGEFRGVAAYLGDEGARQIERMFDAAFPDDEAAFGQDALVLGFVDRALISKAEHARMKRLGVAFKGDGEWPQLESHARDRLPLPARAAEASRMVEVLEQLLEVAPRAVRSRDLLLVDREGGRLVRAVRVEGASRVWCDERRVPAGPVEAPVPEFDRVCVGRLRQKAGRSGLTIECDLFPLPTVIENRTGVPYAPAAFLALDPNSDSILSMDMSEPAGRYVWAQQQLLRCFETLGAFPARVLVQRPELARMFRPMLQACEVELELVERMRELGRARAHFEQMLTMRR
jgi:hypothetical protein